MVLAARTITNSQTAKVTAAILSAFLVFASFKEAVAQAEIFLPIILNFDQYGNAVQRVDRPLRSGGAALCGRVDFSKFKSEREGSSVLTIELSEGAGSKRDAIVGRFIATRNGSPYRVVLAEVRNKLEIDHVVFNNVVGDDGSFEFAMDWAPDGYVSLMIGDEIRSYKLGIGPDNLRVSASNGAGTASFNPAAHLPTTVPHCGLVS